MEGSLKGGAYLIRNFHPFPVPSKGLTDLFKMSGWLEAAHGKLVLLGRQTLGVKAQGGPLHGMIGLIIIENNENGDLVCLRDKVAGAGDGEHIAAISHQGYDGGLGATELYSQGRSHAPAEITGMDPPRWRMPKRPLRVMAEINEAVSNLTGKEPVAAVEAAVHTTEDEYVSCEKAVRELGLKQEDIRIAIRKAVMWYLDNSYVDEERARAVRENLEHQT